METLFILTELYYPEETSTGYYITQIAEGLAKKYKVAVITGPATNFFRFENYQKREIRNNVEVFRCWGTSLAKDSLLSRFINLFSRSLGILYKSLILCSINDCILVVTNPPILPFVALLISYIKKSQIVLLVHDVYPEVTVVSNLLKPSSLLVKMWNLLNFYLYKHSTYIVVIGRDMNQIVKSKIPVSDAHKINYIPNWAENDNVCPTVKANNLLLQELNINQKFVILYAGNMGITHGIETLAAAAKELKFDKDVHFIIVGIGTKKQWLDNYVESQNLTNVSIVPLSRRPRSEQNISLNACDVTIISFIPRMAGISVPSRMYNHMAAGKPIIAVTDNWSELAEVIREEDIGWIVQPGDVKGLVSTIQFASNHPELCAQMGVRATKVAKSKYTFARADKAYKRLFGELFTTG